MTDHYFVFVGTNSRVFNRDGTPLVVTEDYVEDNLCVFERKLNADLQAIPVDEYDARWPGPSDD